MIALSNNPCDRVHPAPTKYRTNVHPTADSNDDSWTDAEETISQFRAALRAHGLTLDELSISIPDLTLNHPKIKLGMAPTDTVRQLTEILLRALP